MNITDELDKLGKLHKDGVLSDDEFVKAKTKLLNQKEEKGSDDGGQASEDVTPESDDNSLGNAANRYVSFQIVMGVIGLIIFVIVALMMISAVTSNHH